MTDPSVNIFNALRRMGAKIPFRFPMVDALVPTVQMYDVSRLVSAPIEPRGLSSTRLQHTVANETMMFHIQALARGGLFLEFLAVVTDQPLGLLNRWSFKIREDPSTASSPVTVIDVGGAPTRSLVMASEEPFDVSVFTSSANLPGNIEFAAAPRFFVPPGEHMILMGPIQPIGAFSAVTISWAELPASFEPE